MNEMAFSFILLVSLSSIVNGAITVECPKDYDKICFKVDPSKVCQAQSDCADKNQICCQTGCKAKLCTAPVVTESPISAPLISQPTNGTGGNTTDPMEPPKPVHMNKEDEAKKGKPYSLHCVVAPHSGNPIIEWSAEKNKIDLDSEKYSYHGGNSRVLTINDVTFSDRDVYTCKSTHQNVSSTVDIRLRVRDPMGAIWPTIGILVEAVLLFIVIFVYEYQRTKPDTSNVKARRGSDGEMKLVN